MSDEDILAGIRRVASEHLAYEGDILPDTLLAPTLELDSIRMLTLVVELENHFTICLEEGDEEGIETVSDLVAVVRGRL